MAMIPTMAFIPPTTGAILLMGLAASVAAEVLLVRSRRKKAEQVPESTPERPVHSASNN